MAPDAKTKDLLYVSDVSRSEVTVYSYPGGTLEGKLLGFALPYGECSDKNGNVFVTDNGSAVIFEYAHGGSEPVATLDDPGGLPIGCSVDPTTGNLAVANQETVHYAAGSIAIYAHASGIPTTYTDSRFYYYWSCTYDDKGNLYVDGSGYTIPDVYAELPAGGSNLENFTIDRSIQSPLGMQWDGKYLAIGAEVVGRVYAFEISGTTGKFKRTTDLNGATGEVPQFWIQSGRRRKSMTLIGADLLYSAGAVDFWHYPSGGSEFKSITSEISGPFGVTVSVAK